MYKSVLKTSQAQSSGNASLALFVWPFDYTSAAEFETTRIVQDIPAKLVQELQRAAHFSDQELYLILIGAVQAFFTTLTGSESITICSLPIQSSDAEAGDGGPLPVQTEASRADSFASVAAEVRKTVSRMTLSKETSGQQQLPMARGGKPLPLLVSMEGASSAADKWQSQLSFIFASRQDETMELQLHYNTHAYAPETITRLAAQFVRFCQQIMADPNICLDDVDLLTEEERHELLRVFNATGAVYPLKPVHHLFEEQVMQTPDEPAVSGSEGVWTYAELNARANRVAHFLIATGVRSEHRIGIMAGHSLEAVAALLGVLKAGAAYVPLDPSYPAERIRFIAADSKMKLLLTQETFTDRVPETTAWFTITETMTEVNESNPELNVQPHHLMYLIYTSGSTGQPKGVMVEHSGAVNYLWWARKHYTGNHPRSFALYSSLAFDLTVTSIYVPLLTGGRIVVYAGEDKGQLMPQLLAEDQVDVLKLTPTHLRLLLLAGHVPQRLRTLIVGGEALDTALARQVHDHFDGQVTIYNEYGPTETVVGCMIHAFDPARDLNSSVPIGRPADNVRVYVLDERLQPVPGGATGELYIAGDGVARGYWGQEERTAERFLEEPFTPEGRMYRTGDIARRLGDGSLVYLGRSDEQVKVRGYRIETGEIEACLAEHENVREAAVVAKPDGESGLALWAYIAADGQVEQEELRHYLQERLPSYMMPSHFVLLDGLPVTANGKTDRRALLEDDTQTMGQAHEEPSGELEIRLAEMWQQVLGREQIGRGDSFFDLGGHSLKAILLLSKVQKEFSITVPLQTLFDRPTIKGLAAFLSAGSETDPGQGAEDSAHQVFYKIYSPIEPIEKRLHYPASYVQKRMYALSALKGAEVTYNVPHAMIIEGPLDADRLQQAANKLIQRHETLRTSFGWVEGGLVQRVHDDADLTIPCSDAEEGEIGSRLAGFIRPFDLQLAPLWRLELIRTGADRYVLLFDMHHIITDGVSVGILMSELSALYEGAELQPLRIQYKDFTVWQREQMLSTRGHEAYWADLYNEGVPLLNLPTDYPRPSIQSFAGRTVTFEVPEDVVTALHRINTETGTTMYMILLAAFGVLLGKYAGQEDVVIGTTSAGRNHADTEHLIGAFINTLALRTRPGSEKTFLAFVDEVKRHTLSAFDHQDFAFDELVDRLKIPRDISRNPLFDTMFVLHNHGGGTSRLTLGKETLIHEFDDIRHEPAKVDLTLVATLLENQKMLWSIEYRTDLFRKETVERMTANFVRLLTSIALRPQQRIGEIDLLTQEERHESLILFNATGAAYPQTPVHQLFEEQVSQKPNEPAVVSVSEGTWTYAELNAKANKVARFLIASGVQAEDRIGVMAEHSLAAVAVLLGVLKAGAAYVPLDPTYPADRIRHIAADSKMKLLLTQKPLASRIPETTAWFSIDGAMAEGDESNPELNVQPHHLMYLIYTSGSTGQPKGVMVEHRGAVNYLWWARKQYAREQPSSFALYSSLAFDLTVTSIYVPLLTGGRIVVCAGEDKGQLMPQMLAEDQVDVLKLTPTHLRLLLLADRVPQRLRTLIVGGEALDTALARQVHDHFDGQVTIYNEYGPTETVVGCMIHAFDPNLDVSSSVPIGRPADNVRIYVLDELLQPVPSGAAGELYIAGDGVARGYWGQEERTAERFLKEPFTPEGRMYRTGDIARRLADGNLIYLGRSDEQVKVRGYRIEIGEIVACLAENDAVREAVVLAKPDGDSGVDLWAYIAVEDRVGQEAIRHHLLERLPEYMVPSHLVLLDRLPVTPNGKTDRRALLEDEKWAVNNAHEDPAGELEIRLAELWQQVLLSERIGRHDSFFSLGGHSLKAIMLLSKVQKEFGITVPLQVLFDTPTIQGLAAFMSASVKTGEDQAEAPLEEGSGAKGDSAFQWIEPAGKRAYYPASYSQKRLYVLNHLAEVTYNVPDVMLIRGALDVERLKWAVQELVNRHETLRTSFGWIDGELVQRVHENVTLDIPYSEQSEDEIDEQIKAFVRPFDLSTAPLLRIELVKLGEDRHLIFSDMHHIITDGVSVEIFFEELMALCAGKPLAPLRIQYKDFSVWQTSGEGAERKQEHEKHWLDVFSGGTPLLNLPTDYNRPSIQSFRGGRVDFEIPKPVTEQLFKISKESGTTLYMILLAVYNVLLSKYTSQDDIVVGTTIAGRNHADTEQLIGAFINTLALRNRPMGEMTFSAFMNEVKSNALKAYEHQDYAFEELVDRLKTRRDVSRNPLFDTMFVLHNHGTGELVKELGPGVRLLPYGGFQHRVAKFDLTLVVTLREDEQLFWSLEYCADLFKHDTIQRMADHFIRLLRIVTEAPERTIHEIDMMLEDERELIVHKFNETTAKFSEQDTVVSLIDEQAWMSADSTAVIAPDGELTYQQLIEQSEKLAVRLAARGVRPGDKVVLAVERSKDMIIGLLGILKAGAVYVPVDPHFPKKRIDFILEDSACTQVLTHSHYGLGSGEPDRILLMDQLEVDAAEVPETIVNMAEPQELCYILYTSGTTGLPKGVAIEHRSLVNRLHWMQKTYPVGRGDTLLQKTPFTFDVSIWELLWGLIQGAKVVFLEPGREREPKAIIEAVETHQVSVIHFVPSMLNAFLEYANVHTQIERLSSLNYVFSSGEVLKPYYADKFYTYMEELPAKLVNLFGPTETTIDSTFYECPRETAGPVVPIGRPIDNTTAYVLRDGRPQPIGVTGELYIGGVGVARGYVGREDLNGESFIPNPFIPNDRIYKTGDLARWRADGCLEYMGRADDQIKVRGYRIEPAEIETGLCNIHFIEEAVVLSKDERLIAYIVADMERDTAIIKTILSFHLPEFMIPDQFVFVDSIPLTANGKADKQSLLQMGLAVEQRKEYEAPETELEKTLVLVWQSVLGISPIGVTDNFFEVGGTSIQAVLLEVELEQQNISSEDLIVFRYNTIREMANYLSSRAELQDEPD
ncbi:non-ribosomal peptide synthetase [Paenibacillus pinihumi]|uniref:non-ribosomal peptide synthetase n=1 Tax=Paenibacillus pinihumi TaxID=669462 RepID=UPI00041D1B74|nr:non-ribosomal peptide synthetase [Paenibacillus pinihumi]